MSKQDNFVKLIFIYIQVYRISQSINIIEVKYIVLIQYIVAINFLMEEGGPLHK